MKSFLLSLFGLFVVSTVSAQNIPDSLFIPKLDAKYQAIIDLIDDEEELDEVINSKSSVCCLMLTFFFTG